MAFMIIVKFYCIHEGVKHTEHRYNSLFLNGGMLQSIQNETPLLPLWLPLS